MRKYRDAILSVIALLLMLTLVALILIDLLPVLIQVVKSSGNDARMVSYLDEYGAKGIPALLGLEILQVVTIFIPAGIIKVLIGLCYGVWIGSLICFAGTVIGNSLVFLLIRQFGKVLGPFFMKKAEGKGGGFLSIKKINDMRHPEVMTFLCYLVPFIPSGILPYIFAQTKMTYPRYIVSLIAAITPSLFLCTWLGERLSKGDYRTAAVLVVFMVIGTIMLIWNKNKIIGMIDKRARAEETV